MNQIQWVSMDSMGFYRILWDSIGFYSRFPSQQYRDESHRFRPLGKIWADRWGNWIAMFEVTGNTTQWGCSRAGGCGSSRWTSSWAGSRRVLGRLSTCRTICVSLLHSSCSNGLATSWWIGDLAWYYSAVFLLVTTQLALLLSIQTAYGEADTALDGRVSQCIVRAHSLVKLIWRRKSTSFLQDILFRDQLIFSETILIINLRAIFG